MSEAIKANAEVAAVPDPGKRGLTAFVLRTAVFGGGTREVLQSALIVCSVVVIEGRDCKHKPWTERANPGKSRKGIVFTVGVAKELALRARIIRVEGDLVEVPPQLRDQAELILRIRVIDQRGEAAEAVGSVVDNRRRGSLQAKIGAVPVHAGVISEAIRVAAKVELVVGLIKVAGA